MKLSWVALFVPELLTRGAPGYGYLPNKICDHDKAKTFLMGGLYVEYKNSSSALNVKWFDSLKSFCEASSDGLSIERSASNAHVLDSIRDSLENNNTDSIIITMRPAKRYTIGKSYHIMYEVYCKPEFSDCLLGEITTK